MLPGRGNIVLLEVAWRELWKYFKRGMLVFASLHYVNLQFYPIVPYHGAMQSTV
jgi:hypothetical protein